MSSGNRPPADEPDQQIQNLANSLLHFADAMLRRYRMFRPMAGVVDRRGEVVHLGGYEGPDRPPSAAVIEHLAGKLRDGCTGEGHVAAGIVYDALATPPGTEEETDAVVVDVDHACGRSFRFFFPYRFDGDELEIGKVFTTPGSHRFYNP